MKCISKQRLIHKCHSNFTYNTSKLEIPKCPPTGESVNKLWYIPSMKIYAAIKRNEPSIQTSTGMNFKIIVLSEKSHTKKSKQNYTTYYSFFLSSIKYKPT